MADCEVLVAGAGPTGLVLALWLARMGVRVRIVDKAAAPATTSRAVAVQARTLELYAQIGLARDVVARGRKAVAANLWVGGTRAARLEFGDMGAGLSPFPYALLFSQSEHEGLLIERLRDAGVEVDRGTSVVGVDLGTDGVRARLRGADARETSSDAAYIAGCDGAHSVVRESLGVGFPGGSYDHLFYVADVEGRGPAVNGEIHVSLDPADFLAIFPLEGDNHVRLVGTIGGGAETRDDLSWDDVSHTAIEEMRITVAKVAWFSTYRVHHRVAESFRRGRAFLAGDAAHIHSPVGGQGMNTGIGDAINLAWKLAGVVRNRLDASVLDSYEPERIAFARRLVATTDQAFTGVTSPSLLARIVRMDLVPAVLPRLFASAAVRRLAFRTVSQTAINYRDSPLSEGRAGHVSGGDRLAWVPHADGAGADNFATLTSLDWQVHVYGAAHAELQDLCASRHLPLHVFSWGPDVGRAGLLRDATYLIRPDGYVAVADASGRAEAIFRYLDRHRILLR